MILKSKKVKNTKINFGVFGLKEIDKEGLIIFDDKNGTDNAVINYCKLLIEGGQYEDWENKKIEEPEKENIVTMTAELKNIMTFDNVSEFIKTLPDTSLVILKEQIEELLNPETKEPTKDEKLRELMLPRTAKEIKEMASVCTLTEEEAKKINSLTVKPKLLDFIIPKLTDEQKDELIKGLSD